MTPHPINLKGPWDYKWVSPGELLEPHLSSEGTVTMPQDWRSLFGDCPGTAIFRRKFHKPTNLDPQERVELVFAQVRGKGQVSLNQSPLGSFESAGESIQFEITQALRSFNELLVQIEFDPTSAAGCPGGLYDVVRLEIHSES